MFYVLDIYEDNLVQVIGLDGHQSLRKANQSKSWQIEGGFAKDYKVASRVGPDKFKCVDTGEVLTSSQCAYTDDAWNEFLERWLTKATL